MPGARQRRRLKKRAESSQQEACGSVEPSARSDSARKWPRQEQGSKREGSMETSAVDDSLKNICEGTLSVTSNWMSAQLVSRLRADAAALYKHGSFTTGALGGRSSSASTVPRVRMCSCCGLFDDAASAVGIGDKHARESLFEAIGKLRNTLSRVLGTPLADVMELQYLRYPGGGKGFYGRHVDQQVRDRGKANRIYSILLYLNDLEWDSVVDGGSLMAYPSGKEPVEVEPVGGTLVLFDSRKLEHEARPTMRERWALVGWFLEGPQLINLDSQPHKKQRTAK